MSITTTLLMIAALLTGFVASDPGWMAFIVRTWPHAWQVAFWHHGNVVVQALSGVVLALGAAAAARSALPEMTRGAA